MRIQLVLGRVCFAICISARHRYSAFFKLSLKDALYLWLATLQWTIVVIVREQELSRDAHHHHNQ